MGTKASDHDAADMCSACHDAYDGRASKAYYSAANIVFDDARFETILNRIERGVLK